MIIPHTLSAKSIALTDIVIKSCTFDGITNQAEYRDVMLSIKAMNNVAVMYGLMRNGEKLEILPSGQPGGIYRPKGNEEHFTRKIRKRMEKPVTRFDGPVREIEHAVLDCALQMTAGALKTQRRTNPDPTRSHDLRKQLRQVNDLKTGLAHIVKKTPLEEIGNPRSRYMTEAVPLLIEFAEESNFLCLSKEEIDMLLPVQAELHYQLGLKRN